VHSHYIDGVWADGAGPRLTVTDPSTGASIWNGAAASHEQVGHACRAARGQLAEWAQAPLERRVAVCRRFRDLLKEGGEQLASVISQEVGKPLWESLAEVGAMANKIDISVQAWHERTGSSSTTLPEGSALLQHRPHGVFGVFGPYNFPGHLPNGHIVPALIAGNTIVFKPSEFAPRTAIETARLWERAGLPPGVLNLVNGARDTGAALAASPELDGILFTGSYQTGALLHRQYAGRPGKMLVLEMGGNNPLVVWDVANIDAAVHRIVLSSFLSAGQRCTCARRLIVENSVSSDGLLARLVEVAARIRIGRYDLEPAPFMGPVVSAGAAARLLQAQADLVARGGHVLLEMHQLQPDTGFLSPGVIDVTAAVDVSDEELFGPLLQVVRVPDFKSALDAANATEYGLAAGLLSDDEQLWQRFLAEIRAGIVNWNRPTTGAASSAPFGGIGRSGNHRPSAYYAADYCAYPVASMQSARLEMPNRLESGLVF
jgi:succinylglutamic semialdehyde dehydrogenase